MHYYFIAFHFLLPTFMNVYNAVGSQSHGNEIRPAASQSG